MKKTLGVAVLFALLMALCVPAVWAAAGTAVQFNDPVLEQKIREQLDRPVGNLYATYFWDVDVLDLSAEDGEQITDLSGLEYFTDLERLELCDNAVTDLTPLAGLTNLWELNLSGNQVSDLSPLEGLTRLENLDLGGNQVSDLSPLAGMNLVSLGLWNNQVTDISALENMDNLEALDLYGNQVTDISALAGKTKLSYLSLADNEITDYSPVADFYDDIAEKDFDLDAATLLRREGKDPDEAVAFADPVLEGMIRDALGIPAGDITLADTAAVQELNLMIKGDDWSLPRIADLSGMEAFENLVYLDLGWALYSEDGPVDLTPLSGLTKLETLLINNDGISDLSAISGLTKLRNLWIWGNDISDISALAGMTQMETIWMKTNQISDISVLAGMPNLYCVVMEDNRIADLTPLAGLPLTELELSGNPIWDYVPIAGLYDQLELKDFDIDEPLAYDEPENPDAVVAFTDPVLERLMREAMNIPEGDITAADAAKITVLDFSANYPDGGYSQEDLIHNLDGLEYFINLRTLAFYSNWVSDLSPLAGLTHLADIDFGDNNVADLSPLENLTQMTNLVFYSNQVEDLSPLTGMTQLTQLWLSGNPIADYSPIQELYSHLTNTDFTYGQEFEAYYRAENPLQAVSLPDPALEQKIREAIGKPEGEITQGDLVNVGGLDLSIEWQEEYAEGTQITDLTGLEYCLNLDSLEIRNADLRDLSPLAGLKRLKLINLLNCGLTDISPLAEVESLTWLELRGNAVTDISPLGGLTRLYGLYLEGNPIDDYSPLETVYPNLTEKDFELP